MDDLDQTVIFFSGSNAFLFYFAKSKCNYVLIPILMIEMDLALACANSKFQTNMYEQHVIDNSNLKFGWDGT